MKNKKSLGNLLLFITAFIWGVAFVFQRSGMDHIGPFTFMAARCLLAVISLGILLVFMKGARKAFAFSKDTIRGGILCGILLTAGNNLQQAGIVYTTAGKAGFITALYILLVPILGRIFFKYRIKLRIVIAVLMGTIGLFLLCAGESLFSGEDTAINFGDILVIISSLFFALHIICTDKFVSRVDAVQMSLIQFMVCTVLGFFMAFLFEEPTIAGIKDAALPIAYVGILSAGVGYTLQIVGQKYTEPAAASLIMCFESVFAAIAGTLVLKETMSPREIAGCIIMFVSIVLVEVKLPEKSSVKHTQ